MAEIARSTENNNKIVSTVVREVTQLRHADTNSRLCVTCALAKGTRKSSAYGLTVIIVRKLAMRTWPDCQIPHLLLTFR
jgi:hypothetical protein